MQRYAWSDDEEDYDNVGVGVAVAGAVSPGFSDEEGEEPAVKQRPSLPAGLVLRDDWMFDIGRPSRSPTTEAECDMKELDGHDSRDFVWLHDTASDKNSVHSSADLGSSSGAFPESAGARDDAAPPKFKFKNRLPRAFQAPRPSEQTHVLLRVPEEQCVDARAVGKA
ncbi:hypothetical protein H632_c592p1 [Helicosporidium sp. ATCC 50920]|nr:hypothetical protein H632_c592p1 [Helicosporidium sp. ATCC 50920]|eukprot:KDD75613.1 hypothetical protein H632_c592p1 [Helicosporidium sp. ATCC 50920]